MYYMYYNCTNQLPHVNVVHEDCDEEAEVVRRRTQQRRKGSTAEGISAAARAS